MKFVRRSSLRDTIEVVRTSSSVGCSKNRNAFLQAKRSRSKRVQTPQNTGHLLFLLSDNPAHFATKKMISPRRSANSSTNATDGALSSSVSTSVSQQQSGVAPKSPVLVSMGRSRLTKEGFIKEVRDRLYDAESGQWNGRFFVIQCNESQNHAPGASATDATGVPVVPMKKNLSIKSQTVSVANCAASWNAARRDKVFSVFLGSPYWLTGKLDEVLEFLTTLGFDVPEQRLSNYLLSPVKMLTLAPKHLLLSALGEAGTESGGAAAANGSSAAPTTEGDKDATDIEPIGNTIIDIATYLEGSLAQEAAEAAEAQSSGGAAREPRESKKTAASAASPSASRAKLSGTELFVQKLNQAKTEGGFVLDVSNWPRVVKTKSSTKNKHQLLTDLPIISSKFDNFLQAMISAGERDRLSFALRAANGKFDGQDLHAVYSSLTSATAVRPLSPVINNSSGSGLESPSVAPKKTRGRKPAESKSGAAVESSGAELANNSSNNNDEDDSLHIPRKSGGAAAAYYNEADRAYNYDDNDDVYENTNEQGDDEDDIM